MSSLGMLVNTIQFDFRWKALFWQVTEGQEKRDLSSDPLPLLISNITGSGPVRYTEICWWDQGNAPMCAPCMFSIMHLGTGHTTTTFFVPSFKLFGSEHDLGGKGRRSIKTRSVCAWYMHMLNMFFSRQKSTWKREAKDRAGWVAPVPWDESIPCASHLQAEFQLEDLWHSWDNVWKRYKHMGWTCIETLRVFLELRDGFSTSCTSCCVGLILFP